MTTKILEIRDSATFIPAVAIKLRAETPLESYYLLRSGFLSGNDVLIVKLVDGSASFDPVEWGTARTMGVAHRYVVQNFDALENGAVVDVEFILGETSEPKVSERLIP